ncbi:MAG: MBOAT family O-acyltransferase [Planctomycetota bacterium]
MVFSSPTFLFLFLPLVLVLHLVLGKRLRNAGLLAASLLFYAWGEGFLVAIMLLSIATNWGLGLWVARARAAGGGKRAVAVSVAFNLGLLVTFKYANWIWASLSSLLGALGLMDGGLPPMAEVLGPPLEALGLTDGSLPADWGIRLPIGISFFTFQAMSYVIDVYRGEAEIQRNPVHFGVYIALFPQLIAGPIVRYRDVAQQIRERTVDLTGFAWGVRRFVVGLGKKMLIANVVGHAADRIFALTPAELTTSAAWLGLVCYTLQIYFDFSGYSDMAIGLGRMLGFRFLENFRFPYVSRSVTEFWRRWHISLSTWYRDYLYIPLGGSRRGPGRTYLNLLIVFALCGLWHGASWSFLVWGLFHGAFLVVERLGLGAALERRPAVLRHAYLLAVVMTGWVFFRAETLTQALEYL